MEINKGMYVKYIRGMINGYVPPRIAKATDCSDKDLIKIDNGQVILKNDILKASYNIIDLIKKKDLILGKDGKIYEVSKVWKDYIFTTTKTKEGLTKTLVDYQIDKILTKEQFESMAYEVE